MVHEEAAAVDLHQRSTFGLVLSQFLFGPNNGFVHGASTDVGGINLVGLAEPRLAAASALGTLRLAPRATSAITDTSLPRTRRLYIVLPSHCSRRNQSPRLDAP
jgi:hypothetical protein